MKNGFTLLEVLIALLAAALISIMSFDFLSNTIFLKETGEFNYYVLLSVIICS